MWSMLLLYACQGGGDYSPVDVAERLGPGQARAGKITSELALFAGISAEGQVGDYKIYNDRVQFVLQSVRPGSYYIAQGGAILDADIVRPEGEMGRDAVDEWAGMYGLGRLVEAESVSVLDDGALGGPAIIRVIGHESPMLLLTGAVESPGIVTDFGLRFQTDYILPPDSQLLEVRTTVTATTQDVHIQPGDLLLGGLEVLEPWEPGVGLQAPANHRSWSGFIGRRNDVALAILAEQGELTPSSLDLLGGLVQMATGFGAFVDIPTAGTSTYARYYGVGSDLAAISDEWLARSGEASQAVDGVVVDDTGAPVAGARVNVLADGKPYTLAVSGADGAYHAEIPAAATASVLAVGRGTGRFMDLAAGHANFGPYGAAPVREASLTSLTTVTPGPAELDGYGAAAAGSPTTLVRPGTVTVDAGDGLPFEVRVWRVGADVTVDPQLVTPRPTGQNVALGWAIDGAVDLALEPGEYHLMAHRGITHEMDEADVTVAAGSTQTVAIELPEAYQHPGYLVGDSHMHASPSADTSIPMEDRIVTAAGVGIQLHFGTDHDHIADYRPIVKQLGLDPVMHSVVADEVSPVLRGHMNIYPVEPVEGEPNHGAWQWWADPVPDTATEFARLRERHEDFILQSNHPTDSGLGDSAGWSPGHIGKPTFWSEGFDAVEVMNDGNNEYQAFYFDVVNRGLRPTPVGVSDSHHYTGLGNSVSFIGMGTDDPTAYTDDTLRAAMRARKTIVSRGPYMTLSIPPGSDVTGEQTLTVNTLAPSWIIVDRLVLYRDGLPIETVQGTTATFTLNPEADATFVVIAEGDTPMPIFEDTPWAMSSPIWLDVDGNGWTAPAPTFVSP